MKRYPHLTPEQMELVFDALREFLQLCRLSRRRMVAMPSQVVDAAWHEFILFTRTYDLFCRQALGRFLHHTPAEAMASPTQAQDGIKRAWRLACHREGINPKTPDRLPLLFAIDRLLNIPDGFRYAVNCQSFGNDDNIYCGSDIGCGGGCGGDSGGDASDGGSDGGCGGGCGGGGD
ncbi:glycine-rich domain-containing protein [Methylomagnum sp.]